MSIYFQEEITDLINNLDNGAIASAALDNPSTLIVRSTVVGQELDMDIHLNGSGSNDYDYVLKKDLDNNLDDSTASNPTISSSSS